jgi:hypothetical protein
MKNTVLKSSLAELATIQRVLELEKKNNIERMSHLSLELTTVNGYRQEQKNTNYPDDLSAGGFTRPLFG